MSFISRIIHPFGSGKRKRKLFLSSFSLLNGRYERVSLIRYRKESASTIDGVETFDKPEAADINRARLEHLESLGLEIQGKSVLDAGCGVGNLTGYFIKKNCPVFCIDGREENITLLKERYPDINSAVADIEKDSLTGYGVFDIVFCYGLLYHLENPVAAIHNIASVCRETLLLETCITDHTSPLVQLVEETASYSQSLTGLGSRPTPAYVITTLLHAGFASVYIPETTPEHPDFRFSFRNDLSLSRDGHLLRQVFIASRQELVNPNLVLVGRCD